ncbi:MAG: diacylglycerol kinase family lipid kinase [Bacteroidales bacterium]|nr:diacylglycerol kinase family lipid kinase [Bacteroidales bacterium]
MEKRRLTLIINPIAGTLSKRGLENWLLPKLSKMGYDARTEYTTGPGDATRLAADAAIRGDYGVLACGGDGTVNEVATGLIGTSTALGILPAGSGNGLARHIGIPIDISRSLKVIAEDHVEACDYGEVNGRPFFCTFGVGFDAAVSERFARKHRRGLSTYIASAIDEFVKYDPQTYEIITGDRVITNKAFLVVVCNASQYGNNTFVAPSASIRDGLLDVTIVHNGTLLTHALSGFEMITGIIGNHGKIQTFRTNELTIRRQKATVTHIDGDPAELPAELHIKCHPGELRIFTTAHKSRFRPIITPLALMLRDWHITLSRLFRRN